MIFKQHGTPLDAILLKVIFPFLFRSGLIKQLPRRQLWHRPIRPEPAASQSINLESRKPGQKAIRPHAVATLGQKRAA
ncbi:MAG: hypothetical protein ACOX87_01770 [Chloroflexota bacterium]|jgi:hypothetical protein